MKRMKNSLRFKSVAIVVIMAMVMAIVAISMSYSVYSNTMDEHYKQVTTNLAKTVASQMDHELLQKYIATGEKDENYEQVKDVLKKILEANQVDCIYILQLRPDQGETFSVIDTDDNVQLGDIDKLVQQMPYGEDELVYISNTPEYGWLCSAMLNMKDANGETYAVMCVDLPMNDVMNDRSDFLFAILLVIGLIMVAVAVIIILLVGKVIVNPIKLIAEAADSFVTDDVINPLKIKVVSNDEIGSLSKTVNFMSSQIVNYIENLTLITAEKERIGAELSVATNIQASMLPCTFPAFPEREDLDIYASMTPAKEVGGDFYDFFLIDQNHLAMVMADVSGKGVPAALFMVIAKTLLKNSAQAGLSPKEVLEKVNAQLCENNEAEMFVTVWFGILDIPTGKVVCANAGHDYPVLKRVDGDYEIIKDKHGFVLAGMDTARYSEYEINLQKGDKLFLYTDGVAEATNINNELFGTDRMLESMNRHRDANCEEILQLLKIDVDAFVGEAPQFDDITMLAVELK